MLITFSGNDGSGKSNFVENLCKELANKEYKYQSVSEFNFLLLDKIAPFIFKGKNRGGFLRREKKKLGLITVLIKNIVNFCAYFLVFLDLFLQTIYFKIFQANKIIIRDRYKLDYLVTLSDLGINNWFLNSLYKLLPEPDLSFFIDTNYKTCFNRRSPINNIEFYKSKEEKYKRLLTKYTCNKVQKQERIKKKIINIIPDKTNSQEFLPKILKYIENVKNKKNLFFRTGRIRQVNHYKKAS